MSSKREIVDHVVKEALDILGNSLSDSEGQTTWRYIHIESQDDDDGFDVMFSFMAKWDDEHVNETITLSN